MPVAIFICELDVVLGASKSKAWALGQLQQIPKEAAGRAASALRKMSTEVVFVPR